MSKVKNLPEVTTLADNDVVYNVDVSAGTNGGRKITKANLKADLAQTNAEVKTAYEANADTNAFSIYPAHTPSPSVYLPRCNLAMQWDEYRNIFNCLIPR